MIGEVQSGIKMRYGEEWVRCMFRVSAGLQLRLIVAAVLMAVA